MKAGKGTAGSVRMVDVAKLAGVSTMTVSRVLNDGPNVTEAMRRKVFAAVEELHYQPNEVARSLREQRSRQIGIIVPYLFDPFFAMAAHAISTVAREHSYSIVLATSTDSPTAILEEARRMLRRNVDGLVLVPPEAGAEQQQLLGPEFARLPIVTIDRPVPGSACDSVLVENEAGGCIGTEHLIRLGHKRIAHVCLSTPQFTIALRRCGYEAAMRGAGLKPQTVLLSGQADDCGAVLRQLLERSRSRPTALFCSNNRVTRRVLHCLNAMKLHTPEDVALVGFDDFDTADLLRPGVTVVRQPVEELGRRAADRLFVRMKGELRRGSARTTVLPVELVVRGSCGG